MNAWRCFVAVRLGEPLRHELAAAVEAWRAKTAAAGLRWTDTDGWHVTLAFLGDTDPAAIGGVTDGIQRAVAGAAAFELTTGGVGAFPSARHGRVAWYGIDDAHGRMAAIAAAVRRATAVEDAPFHAHVTLARARHGRGADLREWIAGAAPPTGRLAVDGVELMRSHLGHGPARYETLASIPLRAPVRA